jgi:hypothetical protein
VIPAFERGDRVMALMALRVVGERFARGTVTTCFTSEIDELADRVYVIWDDGRRRVVRGDTIRKLDAVEMLGELA